MFLSSTKECSDTDFAFESELSVGPFSLSQPNPTVKSFKVLVMLMHTACLLIFAKVAMTTYKHFSGQQQLELVLCENMNKTIKNLQKKLSQKDRKIGQDILCLRCLQWDTPQNSTGFTPFELLCESEVHNYLPIFHGLMIVKTLHYLLLPLLWRLSTLENQMQCTRIWSQLGNQIQCARILCARGWKPAKENVKLRHTKNLFVKSSETLARST